MYYISFDCATKTMGVCILYYDDTWYSKVYHLMSDITTCNDVISMFDSVEHIINNTFKVLYLNVVNVSNMKDHPSTKAKNLKTFLSSLDYITKDCNPDNTKVILEFQMGPNSKSRIIEHFLAYHFCDYDVKITGAMKKNRIELTNTTLQDIQAKYTTSKVARKKHAVQNAKHFLKLWGDPSLLDVKKADDMADACMQILVNLNLSYSR